MTLNVLSDNLPGSTCWIQAPECLYRSVTASFKQPTLEPEVTWSFKLHSPPPQPSERRRKRFNKWRKENIWKETHAPFDILQ